ncbi:tungsten formylmethanofuran dehydrogenase [Methylocapsa palsarum]|uniref:Formylmethanofuran dehydrogenase subunit B n=1 Tax=Methylocapsa palsarum TaxID=1612308 RepID=A0A1I3VX65_9HYPH|nr:tungsten formylmethanofuran dehydrogenase [Methylocapsa palsarum]SFJ98731.1 formylmethanofuran dehydrogenase subunit B [Methylocapsa palsarum]
MVEARIDGKPAGIDAAVKRAAEILGAARFPVIAGLGTDVAGARASIALAERLRGAYDHLGSKRIFADLDVLRQAGQFLTTPNEARLHADVLLFVGRDLTRVWPKLLERLAPAEKPELALEPTARKIIWIDAGAVPAELNGLPLVTLDAPDLRSALALVRARVAGKPVAASGEETKKFDEIAKILNEAKFGAAIWGGETIDQLAIEMLYGLLADLNKTTRFSGFPVGAGDNSAGVVLTSGWMTGFPIRTGFGRGYPEHDPWRFDAIRLIESGETDAALWVSSYSQSTPQWEKDIPLVALVAPKTKFGREPQVVIEVGCPGVDHDGAEFARDTGSIIARAASNSSGAPLASAIIARIAEQIDGAV